MIITIFIYLQNCSALYFFSSKKSNKYRNATFITHILNEHLCIQASNNMRYSILLYPSIRFKLNITQIQIFQDSFSPFLLCSESKLKHFAQSNPDCSDEQPFLIKTIYRGNQSEKKKSQGI